MVKRLLLVLLAGGVTWGCATQSRPEYVREGVQYGVTDGVFRGRWWSYYERGTSFLEGGFHQEAIADFQQALTGRSRDTWSARTYGLHFVEYFPNRELGVAFYHTGDYDQAEQHLQASLEQIDTARARHFLDLITKARLEAGQLIDEQEPAIEMTLTDEMVVASSEIEVEITANDDVGVEQVVINNEPQYQRGSEKEVTFKKELKLAEGAHNVEVQSGDLAEKQTADEVEVVVDLTGPTVGVMEPPPNVVTDAPSLRLRGATIDNTGVSTVALGQRVIAEGPLRPWEPRVNFLDELPLETGRNMFIVVAKDVAGNETRAKVSVFKGTQDQLAEFVMSLPDRFLEPLRFANVRFNKKRYNAMPTINGRAIFAQDGAAPSGAAIEVKYPTPGADVRKNEIRVSGEVQAPANLSTATIKVASASGVQEYAIETAGAPKVAFSKRVPVQPGQNAINIAIADEQGNAAQEDVTIEARPVVLDTPESKMAVAVLAFGGTAEEATRLSLREQTESRLLDQGRFTVLERLQLAQVLQEQELSAALSDPNQALELGKVLPANIFLIGEVIERDAQIEMYVRAINTETSEIAAKFDSLITDKAARDKVEYGVLGVVEQLRAQFPRVSGELTRVVGGGKSLLANLGEDDGVRSGMYFLVVYEEEPLIDETTGEVLFEGEYIPVGRAKITRVQSSASMADVVAGEEGSAQQEEASFEEGMPVITM